MGADKRKAVKGARRIPEASMFTIAILGGSVGVMLGMRAFHHKTLHTSFTVGMPLILFFEVCLVIIMIYLIK